MRTRTFTGWRGRHIVLSVLIAVYTASIPLVTNLQVDQGLRLLLYRNRSYLVLASVAVGMALLIIGAPQRVGAALRSNWHRRMVLASLAFPCFYAGAAIIKGRVSIPVIGLYFVWSIALFFVAPLVFGRRIELRAALFGLFAGNSFAWALGYYLFKTEPAPIALFAGRESFGYANPNMYAQMLQVVFCTASYFLATSGGRLSRLKPIQVAAIVVCIAIGVFVYAAHSRNVMAFGLAAVTSYFLLRFRWRSPAPLLVVGGMATTLVLLLAYSDFREVNRFSSNRLVLWRSTIEVAFVRDGDPVDLLIGTDEDLAREIRGRGYSDLRGMATFQKFHVDSFFLELLVEGGLVGTILFVWPYWLIVVVLWRMRRDPDARTHANLGIALIVGLGVQGVFAPTIPSFNNPLGWMFCLVAVSIVSAGMRRERWRDVVRRGRGTAVARRGGNRGG